MWIPKGVWEQCRETSGSTRDREFLKYVGCYCLLQTEVVAAEFLNKLTRETKSVIFKEPVSKIKRG